MSPPKKNAPVSGNASDEENLHSGGYKLIFIYLFTRDIIFSYLVSFTFLHCFFPACLFFAIKNIYSDTHLTSWVGE